MTTQEIYDLSKKYNFFTWTSQNAAKPIVVDHTDGIYFWDTDGNKYTDINSMLSNVNIGFQNEAVIKAIQDQAEELAYIAPSFTYEKRAELGRLIIEECAPKNMQKVLFTNGGADANEYAIRLAKAYTGREKIFSKYESYHGSTYGAAMITGEAERSSPEPGIPGFIKFLAPHAYTYDIQFDSEEEATKHFLYSLEHQIKLEGPDRIAALFIETVPGSNGVYVYPKGYLKGVRELCTKYGIVMVCDEVMAGFCRCGDWFACETYGVEPDIITCAKGINSGYAPLGGVIVNKKIAEFFDTVPLPAGLTYNAHPISVAAAIACIHEYQRLDTVSHVKKMGKLMHTRMEDMKAHHPCVGDVRNAGLLGAVELVKNKKTHEPLSQTADGTPILSAVLRDLLQHGMYTTGHNNTFKIAPALIVTEDEMNEIMDGVDKVMYDFDPFAEA